METYFNQTSTTRLSKTSKANFTKFMADKFEATSTGTATKLQCQNCKRRFSKHFILPMYPQPLHLCDSNTYLFCWACLQAPGDTNYMIHPGPWLNTTTESESANIAPTRDLNQLQNRPWALQSLDADYGKDFSPFVWIIAVQPDAHSAQEGVIQHSWNHLLNRWQRFPFSHISEANRVTRYDITEFQRLTNKVWKLKAANLSRHHHLTTRSSTYAQTLHQLRLENPYICRRRRTTSSNPSYPTMLQPVSSRFQPNNVNRSSTPSSSGRPTESKQASQALTPASTMFSIPIPSTYSSSNSGQYLDNWGTNNFWFHQFLA